MSRVECFVVAITSQRGLHSSYKGRIIKNMTRRISSDFSNGVHFFSGIGDGSPVSSYRNSVIFKKPGLIKDFANFCRIMYFMGDDNLMKIRKVVESIKKKGIKIINEIRDFCDSNKVISWFTVLAVTIIFLIYPLNDSCKNSTSKMDLILTIPYNLAMAYLGSLIFYIVQSYIPNKKLLLEVNGVINNICFNIYCNQERLRYKKEELSSFMDSNEGNKVKEGKSLDGQTVVITQLNSEIATLCYTVEMISNQLTELQRYNYAYIKNIELDTQISKCLDEYLIKFLKSGISVQNYILYIESLVNEIEKLKSFYPKRG